MGEHVPVIHRAMDWLNRHQDALEIVAFWGLSRILILLIAGNYASDLPYYEDVAVRLQSGESPYTAVPLDHPPLAVILIWFPSLLDGVIAYSTAFRGMMLLFDAVTTAMLALFAKQTEVLGSMSRTIHAYVWLSSLLFPFLFDRVDGALVFMLVASLWLYAKHRYWESWILLMAAVLINAGAILICAVLLWQQSCEAGLGRRRNLLAAACSLAFLIILSLVFPDPLGVGLLRSLQFHWARGIEIESLAGSFAAVGGLIGFDVAVDFTTGAARVASSMNEVWALLAVAAIIATLLAARRTGRNKTNTMLGLNNEFESSINSVMLSILVFLLIALTLFPQYVLWIMPLAALQFGLKRDQTILNASLVAGIATTTVFPIYFGELVELQPVAVLLLAIRNAALMYLCYSCARSIFARRDSEQALREIQAA